MKRYLRLIPTFGLGIMFILGIVLYGSSGTNGSKNNAINWDIDYHQLYVVGDSLSDSGALVGAGSQLLKLLGQNHGLTLAAPFYQNRSFSNGAVAVEVLAKNLNLTLKPAWDFDFNKQNLQQTGTNYAVAGATALELDSLQGKMLLNHFTINRQVDALLKQHQVQDDDLIVFEIGSNDLMSQVLNASTTDQAQIIKNLISSQEQALEKLLVNGSKHILVMNSPDLSRTPNYFDDKIAHKVSVIYNQSWNLMINKLQAKYPHSLKAFDLYHQFYQLLSDFREQGVDILQTAITWKFDFNVLLTKGIINSQWNAAHNQTMIDQYFFFDFLHPTAKVHQAVGDMLYHFVKSSNTWWY